MLLHDSIFRRDINIVGITIMQSNIHTSSLSFIVLYQRQNMFPCFSWFLQLLYDVLKQISNQLI